MRPDDSVPASLVATFSPLDKAAFGIAVGLVAGMAVAAITVFHVLAAPAHGPNLALLEQFFYGYSVSWRGALIGFGWALFAGFVMGWFAAFVRNLVIAVWFFTIRARAELSQLSDFLSHI